MRERRLFEPFAGPGAGPGVGVRAEPVEFGGVPRHGLHPELRHRVRHVLLVHEFEPGRLGRGEVFPSQPQSRSVVAVDELAPCGAAHEMLLDPEPATGLQRLGDHLEESGPVGVSAALVGIDGVVRAGLVQVMHIRQYGLHPLADPGVPGEVPDDRYVFRRDGEGGDRCSVLLRPVQRRPAQAAADVQQAPRRHVVRAPRPGRVLDDPLLRVEHALLQHVLGDGAVRRAVRVQPHVEVDTRARAVLVQDLLRLAAVVEPYGILRGRALAAG